MDELTTMTVEECWQRLGAAGVGRVGFDRGRGPRIHPVDYTVADGTVLLRTSEDSELADFVRMFGEGSWMAFEVDQVDPAAGLRWSVLVDARVEQLDGAAMQDLDPAVIPVPTPAGPHDVLVRLTPVEITGRQLLD